jgi:putative methionine-R-sulfoxide reductase with GAF domain
VSGATAPTSARVFLRDALHAWELDGFSQVAELLTSELVNNVVCHVGLPFTVRALRQASRLRVEVEDPSREPPKLRHPQPLDLGGRGIQIIDGLSDAWGTDKRDEGKTVWFELDVPTSTAEGHTDAVASRLEKLEALTDTTLTRLDVDDLVVELLIRVREILDVDTAAVLLLDTDSETLVARAACGIEEEVRQGVRVPIGTGFAGRIAATREPVRLDRVDSTTVANPLLWERGIKVMLGVPLLSQDAVLGVLHVGRLENRPFRDADSAMLQVVADRVAAAIQARTLAIERAATLLLERSLLPERLPKCPALTFAARYVPAEGRTVGGDWYDLFMLPSGQLWIVVGDVAGHGVQSAVVMGRIRSALRAYTLVDTSPAHVLDLVDRKVDQFEIDTIATIACAVSSPPYETLSIAVAGHPPPIVAVPGRRSSFANVEGSPPIGAPMTRERRSTTIALAADTAVAFYTDGLIERPGESIDVGLERLRDATSTGPPERVAADIMRKLVGNTITTDDVALVVMRRTAVNDPR